MPPKKKIIESLDEAFLKHVADKYNISLPAASLKIDECIQMTAATLNVSYATVYNIVFSKVEKGCPPDVGIAGTLIKADVCDALTVDECNKSCNCFTLEPYGCLPRTISDADIINEDPDKYVMTHLGKTPDLIKMVQIAAYLYYNYDGGGLTDNSFDALEYHLKKREKIKGRAYEKIGALPVDKIRKRLRFMMSSLEKRKPGTTECSLFLSQFIGSAFMKPVPCSWSLKLDGVSGMAIYENGNLVELNTRGDGIIGGNVTYLAAYITSVPKKLKSTAYELFVVRGEFVLPKDKWEHKYKGTYSNARAFVSGKINAGFVSPALHDIDFVVYEIMHETSTTGMVPQPSQSFKILGVEGFLVVDNDVLHSPTVFEIIELYKKQRLEAKYIIDGLVLAVDKAQKGIPELDKNTTEATSPTYKIAFKMTLEDQMRSTKIINVEWNISRYGRYVPVAIYEAVYVEGVRLARATAHNARHVLDWRLGKGTKVKVVRSGDVIPVLKDVEVNANITPVFPPTFDEGGYEYHWDKSDIVLDDIDNNKDVLIKRVVHFFETIGVARLGQKTAEKLYEAGMTTPESIVKSDVANFIKIKGIGKKTAEGYYHGIRKIMAITPPDRFIIASTTFKSGLGRKMLKQLFKEIPAILDMSEEKIAAYFKSKKVAGFGPMRIKTISEGIPKFREYLDSFAKEDVEKAILFYTKRMKELDEKGRNPLIAGKKFVTTNFMGNLDYELEDYIFDNDGEFVSTVTSSVSAVICGNVMSLTDKMSAASELEVPVLSLQEFSERFNVPLKRFEKAIKSSEDEDD